MRARWLVLLGALGACGVVRSGLAARAAAPAAVEARAAAPLAGGEAPSGVACRRAAFDQSAALMPWFRALEMTLDQAPSYEGEPVPSSMLSTLCLEDARGAWAVTFRGLEPLHGRRVEGAALKGQWALVRLDRQGAEQARSRWYSLFERELWDLSIEGDDFDGDGIFEVAIDESTAFDGPDDARVSRRRLLRLGAGAVVDVPGTERLWIEAYLSTREADERAFRVYHRGAFFYHRPAGMDDSSAFDCSREITQMVALRRPDGSFSEDDARSVDESRQSACDTHPPPEGSRLSWQNAHIARQVQCLLLEKKREQAVAMAARCKRSPEDTCGYCESIRRWLAVR